MTHKDLKVGDRVMYQEDPNDEKVQATVLEIDNINKIVKFYDWEDFEWDSPFDEIPETVKRIL